MTDKKIPLHKEIAMGIAGKYETSPSLKGGKKQAVSAVNKKCGGKVTKKGK